MSNLLICPAEEVLLSAAMAESAPEDVRTHVKECANCRARLEELRAFAASLRQSASSAQPGGTTTIQQDAGPPLPERPARIGKYLIVGELGHGGQARVFRALHPGLDRDVAIKWANQNVSPETVDLLSREGKVLAGLEHPGIARVFDVDVEEGRPFLVIEYVRGSDLEQYARRVPVPPARAADLVAQLARALAYAHERGIIHQDIKPGNILVDEDGRPKLSDFGLAHRRDLWNQNADQPGGGTLDYMAPEQMSDPAAVSPASDVYGLGGVLFFLLTGRAPRPRLANPVLACEQVARGEIDAAPLSGGKVPRRLADVCRRALAADPLKRYRTADALADDLEQFVQRPRVWRRRLGAFAAAAAVFMLLSWSLYLGFKPAPAPALPSRPVVLRHFLLDVPRGGKPNIPKTDEDLRRLLPFGAGDELRVGVVVPAGVKPALFAVTLSDPALKVRSLKLEPAKGRFNCTEKLSLQDSPDTELLFLCGAAAEVPALDDVQGLLTELAAKRPRRAPAEKLRLPYPLSFQTDQVDDPFDELVRGRVGNAGEDPVTQALDFLEQVRAKLRAKYPFVAGLAFTHVPQAEATSGQRAGPGPDAPPQDSAWGGTAAEQTLFREVLARLLQTDLVRKNYPPEFHWPPKIYIEPSSRTNYNAFAGPYAKDSASGKYLVRAFITEGYMTKIVKGDGEKLAAIMGHELAHITKGHLFNRLVKDVPGLAFSRQQEIEADLEGVKIAAAAGFSALGGIKAAMAEWQQLGDYSNFEGIKVTHPSWTDRLTLLDTQRASMWQAMAAYQNGYFFLHAEQYPVAEDCFLQVTKEFPDCGEAWANLGYARLMRYCDSLEAADLRRFGLAQFVAGGFYARPQVDELTRGDPTLWRAAVTALETALQKNDSLVLARANLGLAYLVAPAGKQAENKAKALAYFDAAAERALADKGINALNRAAVLTNFGVAELALGQVKAAKDDFKSAKDVLPPRGSAIRHQLDLALLYNEAILGIDAPDREDRAKAFRALEEYLVRASPDATWWTLAHDHYVKLAADLAFRPLDTVQLKSRFGGKLMRPVVSVDIPTDKRITLSDKTQDVLKLLGRDNLVGIPVVKNKQRGVQRYQEVAPGIDLLADRQVLAIFLTSDKAPHVYVQARGAGAEKRDLHVGMATRELLAILADQPGETCRLDRSTVEYVFIPELGLGFRFADDRVLEIVLAQPPRKTPF